MRSRRTSVLDDGRRRGRSSQGERLLRCNDGRDELQRLSGGSLVGSRRRRRRLGRGENEASTRETSARGPATMRRCNSALIFVSGCRCKSPTRGLASYVLPCVSWRKLSRIGLRAHAAAARSVSSRSRQPSSGPIVHSFNSQTASTSLSAPELLRLPRLLDRAPARSPAFPPSCESATAPSLRLTRLARAKCRLLILLSSSPPHKPSSTTCPHRR